MAAHQADVSPEQWKKYYESLVPRIKQLEDQVITLTQENAQLRAQSTLNDIRMDGQNSIVQNAINAANATSQSYLEENKQLRREIAELKAKG